MAWRYQRLGYYRLARRYGDRTPALSHNRSRCDHQHHAGAEQWDTRRVLRLCAHRHIHRRGRRLLSQPDPAEYRRPTAVAVDQPERRATDTCDSDLILLAGQCVGANYWQPSAWLDWDSHLA